MERDRGSTRAAAGPSLPGWLGRPGRRTLFFAPFLLALLLSLPALRWPLVWDDINLLAGDTFTHRLRNVPAAFTRPFWNMDPPSRERFDYYRPVTTVTYILNYAAGGLRSEGYHGVNSLLYALTCGLLGLTLAELGLAAGVALAGATLFAAWPAHNESVLFIAGRTDLLAGGFGLLQLFFCARHRRDRGPGALNLAGMVVAGAGAAFSKEVGFAMPVVILAHEWASGWRRDSWIRSLASVVPAAAGFTAARLVLAGRPHAAWAGVEPFLTTFGLASSILLLPWPPRLGITQYPHLSVPGVTAIAVWAVAAALALFTLPGRGARAAWALAWAILGASCIIGMPAERLTYIPSMFLLPLWAERLSRLPWQEALRGLAWGGLVAAAAAGFLVGGQKWASMPALMEAGVRTCPGDPSMRDNLADAYYYLTTLTGAPDTARARLLEMSAEQSRYSAILDARRPRPWFSLSRTYFDLGRDARALDASRRGQALGELPAGFFMRAQILTRMGRFDEADDAAYRALADPVGMHDPERWTLLGWIRFRRGDYGQSVLASRQATKIDPRSRVAAYNMALALACSGADSADTAFRNALRVDDDGSGAAAALEDIAEHGARGGKGAEVAARAFFGAAAARFAAHDSVGDALEVALGKAAQTWPKLRDLAPPGAVR
ncbi:MAG: tetratricopeptide repeat protein [Candidatus Eisenbacteria bacterium]|nr:tetratricopeptide repeat protein [Candidatus Eisenbacteria bacterium]